MSVQRAATQRDSIEQLRATVEVIDAGILELIARRYALSRRIGEAKRDARRAILDPAQEAAVVRRAAELARSAGLPVEPVRELYWRLVGLCRCAQLEQP